MRTGGPTNGRTDEGRNERTRVLKCTQGNGRERRETIYKGGEREERRNERETKRGKKKKELTNT